MESIRSAEQLEAFVRSSRQQVVRFEGDVARLWLGSDGYGSVFESWRWTPQELLTRAQNISELRLDVQVSTNGVFNGDEARRRSVSLNVSSLLSLAACSGSKTHWLRRATDGLQFYAAQAPVLVRRASGAVERSTLFPLFSELRLPPFAATKARLNAWIGAGWTVSPAHYDADDNVLSVLSGSKAVHFAPYAQVESLPCWGASPNHAAHPASLGHHGTHVVIEPGQALYVPRGTWHQVESTPGTVAVNAWFRLASKRSDVAYLARCAIIRATEAEVSHQIRRTDSIARLRSLARRDGIVEEDARREPNLAAALWSLGKEFDARVSADVVRDVRAARDEFARRCFVQFAHRVFRRDSRLRFSRRLLNRHRIRKRPALRRLLQTV